MANELGECKQLQLLRVTIRKATEDVVNSLSNEEAVSLLSGVHPHRKDKKMKLVQLLKDSIVSGVENNIDKILRDEEFDKILRERETLIQKQKSLEGTVAWRPTGSVIEDMRSRDMDILTKKTKQMGEMCRREEVEVNTLQCKVNESWIRILSCQKNVNDAKKKFDGLKGLIEDEEAAYIHMTKSLYNDQTFI